MSKRAVLAATALVFGSFGPVLNAPAMALPPVVDTTGLSPDEVCEAVLKPNDPNSQFTTYATNISGSGEWVTVSTDIGAAIGAPYGVGTPTYSDVIIGGSYFRNGGSPNVWARATATQTYPQTGQMHETEITQQRTTTFDCVVEKTNPAQTIEPEGLQSYGNQSVEEQVIDGDPVEVVIEDDFVVYGQTVHALICISPNNVTKGKPGTWTGKNGFDPLNCPAASIAAAGTVPSDNAPDI